MKAETSVSCLAPFLGPLSTVPKPHLLRSSSIPARTNANAPLYLCLIRRLTPKVRVENWRPKPQSPQTSGPLSALPTEP